MSMPSSDLTASSMALSAAGAATAPACDPPRPREVKDYFKVLTPELKIRGRIRINPESPQNRRVLPRCNPLAELVEPIGRREGTGEFPKVGCEGRGHCASRCVYPPPAAFAMAT